MAKKKRGLPREDPDDQPAPTEHNKWSTVQAAITGGWSETARLITIMIVVIPVMTIVMVLLGLKGATSIPAFAQMFK